MSQPIESKSAHQQHARKSKNLRFFLNGTKCENATRDLNKAKCKEIRSGYPKKREKGLAGKKVCRGRSLGESSASDAESLQT